jgi:hypothetical protein
MRSPKISILGKKKLYDEVQKAGPTLKLKIKLNKILYYFIFEALLNMESTGQK